MTKSKLTSASSNNKMKSNNNTKSGICRNKRNSKNNNQKSSNKMFDELFYESFVEKYNEKINLWQNYYLLIKNNYLYLFDKKPKFSEKPKEYLYLSNKISMTFHRRLFKLKAIKNYVVNIKINNEDLIKSSIEDNKHNIYISFKSQNNYNNFRKTVEDVLKYNQNINSVSPNHIEDAKIKKYKSFRHLKNKSESHIQFNNNLFNKNVKDEINSNDNKSFKSKINMKSNNKNNNSYIKSINNVFTFSKVEGSNGEKIINSNNSKRSNSCNTNNRKNQNNFIVEEENSNELDNTVNNVKNSKKCINYFNVNLTENNLKLKYIDDDTSINNNKILNDDFSPLIRINSSNIIHEKTNTSLVYSIKRKKEKEIEDENKINNKYKKQRRNSCYGFSFNNFKYNNIFLHKNKNKEENKIKTIKIKLKDYHSFCNIRPSFINKINISDYSRDEKNKSFENITDTQELTNYSFNEIEEKNSDCKSSKKKEKENEKTKYNSNTDISLNSLKSYKSENKEKEKELKENTKFEYMDLYSYIDTSNISKNDNKDNSNQSTLLEDNNKNVSNIRNQISKIIKKNEEIISKSQNECENKEKDNESDTDIIFTSRIREEITEPNSKNKEEINNKEKNMENYNNNINNCDKIEESSNEGYSNIIDTSNIHQRNHLRFSSDLNDIMQNLEIMNKYENNRDNNKISIPFNIFYKRNIEFNYLDLNIDCEKDMFKKLVSKIDNNEIFIYDSYICDLLLTKIKENIKCLNSILEKKKGEITKNKIIGKIYESINNKNSKYFLLCEMISIISKYEISEHVINAIEVYYKKREINKDEKPVNYDEYIINIFNKYLSRNEQNYEYKTLYNEILPKKLKEYFQLKESEGSLINIIKNEIHPNTLFDSMQYYNKIYFYNINIEKEFYPDFNSLNPFDNNTFKFYVSPCIIQKWKLKARYVSLSSNKNSINQIDIEKEKEIYIQYKRFEKLNEALKFNLFQNIISNINQNEICVSLKNCEYFLEKYKGENLFLHSLIYLCLSFIYSKTLNYELSEKYYIKSSLYIQYLFPNQNNFMFFDLEYKHILILLNNKEDIILENVENINNLFEKCEKMWNKFYGKSENMEFKIDEIIFRIYFEIDNDEKNNECFLNDFYYNNIKPLIEEFEDKLKKRKPIINSYAKLFIEFFKICPGCNISIFNDLIRYYKSFE